MTPFTRGTHSIWGAVDDQKLCCNDVVRHKILAAELFRWVPGGLPDVTERYVGRGRIVPGYTWIYKAITLIR